MLEKRKLNNLIMIIEISIYLCCIITFIILSIYNICSNEVAAIIYSIFMILSFGYLLLLEFVLKKYDNAVHFKMFRKYYNPVKNPIKTSFKRKGIFSVIVLWILYLAVIGIFKYFAVITWQLYLIGASVIFILNSIFTRKICFLSVFFLHNKYNCCKNCGINCWDYLIFASALIFAPYFNIYTLVLNIIIILVSLVMMILWEIKYHKYPYRFYPETNKTLWCVNCLKQCKYSFLNK